MWVRGMEVAGGDGSSSGVKRFEGTPAHAGEVSFFVPRILLVQLRSYLQACPPGSPPALRGCSRSGTENLTRTRPADFRSDPSNTPPLPPSSPETRHHSSSRDTRGRSNGLQEPIPDLSQHRVLHLLFRLIRNGLSTLVAFCWGVSPLSSSTRNLRFQHHSHSHPGLLLKIPARVSSNLRVLRFFRLPPPCTGQWFRVTDLPYAAHRGTRKNPILLQDARIRLVVQRFIVLVRACVL
jgi:hypothetical protein